MTFIPEIRLTGQLSDANLIPILNAAKRERAWIEPLRQDYLSINTQHRGSVEEPEKPKGKVPVKAELNVIFDNLGALNFFDVRSFLCLASYFKTT
jgi:hypothetical protein